MRSAVLFLVVVTGCSSPTAEPTLYLVMPERVDFGTVAMTGDSQMPVKVTNPTARSIALQSFSGDDPAFETHATFFHVVLHPGASYEFMVRFADSRATLVSPHVADFMLRASEGIEAHTTLVGTSVFVSCAQSGELIDFGLVAHGSTLRRTFQLLNETGVETTAWFVLETGGASEFVVPEAAARTLAPGEVGTWNIDFTPADTRYYDRGALFQRSPLCPVEFAKLRGFGT